MSATVDLIYRHAKQLPEAKALEALDFIVFLESRAVPRAQPGKPRYSLRGKPVRYHKPFEPVAVNDWDALS